MFLEKSPEMRVVFNELTAAEIKDAVAYYELEIGGLGSLFREEVKNGINRIKEYPEAWAKERGEIRRYVLHRFPYKILYSIGEDHIFIIAIAHQHRKPDYWIDTHSS